MNKEHGIPSNVNVEFDKLMSCYPTNQTNFEYLVRLMQRNVVVPFLGAGISANFSYPGWDKFIRKQADILKMPEVETALKDRQYEKAASLLKNRLTGNMWEYILLQEFGDHVYKASVCSDELELIPRLFRFLILTTNFDEVIEMLYAKVNGEYIEKLTPMALKGMDVIYKRIACGEPTLIKLHGDVATREFILTEQEYNRTYGESVLDIRLPLPSFLRDILLSKVILFLGCSLEDDRTLRVIEQARVDGSMSFALLPLPEKTENKNAPWKPDFSEEVNGNTVEKEEFIQRQRFLNEHNIIPIWYPWNQHQALKIFLKELAYRVSLGYKMSVTSTREKLDLLLKQGRELESLEKVQQAFLLYAEAEKLIKRDNLAFTKDIRIRYLQEIKRFYNSNGYIYERKEILKDILTLTKQSKHYYSVEMAMCYHDIGYMFERYRYYRLMLKAMIRSCEILGESRNGLSGEELKVWFDKALFIYMSLGYVYLKNKDYENSKIWYEKAGNLNRAEREISAQAFVNNGLCRYYRLLGETDKALDTLGVALKQRRTLSEEKDDTLPQHIINTHSNRISIYLNEKNDVDSAEKEFESCMEEDDIKNRLRNFPDARRRILTDHGDILKAKGNYEEAFAEYEEALKNKKYMHFGDDFTTAELYHKMGSCLKELPDRLDEALEYLIQAFVIYEKLLGKEAAESEKVNEDLQTLRKNLGLDESSLTQRLTVQRSFLDYRSDERVFGREDELIRYFEL